MKRQHGVDITPGRTDDEVSEWRLLHSYSAHFEPFIERLHSLADGLTEVTIEISDEGELWVVGHRAKTDEERHEEAEEAAAVRTTELAELERLQAKYAGPTS